MGNVAGAGRRRAMTGIDVDKMGPVDYLVVEFPADKADFSGEIASELKKLTDSGIVRVLDMLLIYEGSRRIVRGGRAARDRRQRRWPAARGRSRSGAAARRGRRRGDRRGDGARQRGCGSGLGERFRRSVRRCRAACRRTAGCQRPDPGPGAPGSARSRARGRIGRSLRMPPGRGRMGRPGVIGGGIGRRDDRGDRREGRREDRGPGGGRRGPGGGRRGPGLFR